MKIQTIQNSKNLKSKKLKIQENKKNLNLELKNS